MSSQAEGPLENRPDSHQTLLPGDIVDIQYVLPDGALAEDGSLLDQQPDSFRQLSPGLSLILNKEESTIHFFELNQLMEGPKEIDLADERDSWLMQVRIAPTGERVVMTPLSLQQAFRLAVLYQSWDKMLQTHAIKLPELSAIELAHRILISLALNPTTLRAHFRRNRE